LVTHWLSELAEALVEALRGGRERRKGVVQVAWQIEAGIAGVWRAEMVELTDGALEALRRVDPRTLPTASRRTRHRLCAARAHVATRRDDAAVRAMLAAEAISPDVLAAGQTIVRELVRTVLRRGAPS